MLRQLDQSPRAAVLVMDVILSAIAFVGILALAGRESTALLSQPDSLKLIVLGLVASLVWPVMLLSTTVERATRQVGVAALLGQMSTAGSVSIVVVAGVAYAIRAPVLPVVLAQCVAGQFAVVGLLRVSVLVALRLARRRGRDSRNLLIAGSGPRARQVQHLIELHPEWGYQVAGFVDESGDPMDPEISPTQVHKLIELPGLLRDCAIDEVIAACPRSVFGSLGSVVGVCAEAGVPVTVLSDIFGDYVPPPQITQFGTLAALNFSPVHHNRLKLRVKRAIDVVGSGTLLALAAPLIAVAVVAIRATSSGPVFFQQIRCGRYGHHFGMLKLRSMVIDAEEKQAALLSLNEMEGPVFKIKADPRITSVGRLLRRWSIDELPQLWNVFRGDMSLVGPRPPVPMEVVLYQTHDRRRLSMRPGITCLWQVSGRNKIGFDDWVRLDIQYIDSWSLINDFKILLRTIPAVLRGTGS
ncbi:MAG: sugar transferase [Deltaproteobacteria bacterium]|nr:sugar transferase [Deltaproteobacteria bacterium]